jgi:hypothetical protein
MSLDFEGKTAGRDIFLPAAIGTAKLLGVTFPR